jgi:hypothetical protein
MKKITTLIFDLSRVLLFTKDREDKTSHDEIYNSLLLLSSTPNILEYFELNIELIDHIKSINSQFNTYVFTKLLFLN